MNEPSRQSDEAELFERALERPTAERDAFLDAACGDRPALRARLAALLAADSAAGGFLETPAVPDLAPALGGTVAAASMHEEKPGDRIDRYRLVEKIGEGGCGVVFLAEQEEPIRRRVALKVIKLGMDTREVIGRFDAERQALALMDHPNIARVLDAGATAAGRPYFVMELVRGMRLTDYCDQHRLTAAARLQLFVQVCHAVQHAHQKGVIHRDLKPSNILVTLHDGEPVPKIIDFGIAKATAGSLTEQSVHTAFTQFVGTPAYMSPEQAQLTNQDIDTRADVYSLGVLLYELLTGRPPFEPATLLQGGLDEMRRRIRETEPPRPSTRLSTLRGEAALLAAELRATDLPRLRRFVRGDLDWIVMKCLEKDRRRRYETANSLAQDVEHFLHDEPVSAAAPGTWRRLRKLARRHRPVVYTALFFVVALAAVAAGSAVLAVRATHRERAAEDARRRAEERQFAAQQQAAASRAVEQFLRTHLLAATSALPGDEATLCSRLDQAAAEIHARPPEDPAVEIGIRDSLAAGYRSLGLQNSLQQQLARINELYRRDRGDTVAAAASLSAAPDRAAPAAPPETPAPPPVPPAERPAPMPPAPDAAPVATALPPALPPAEAGAAPAAGPVAGTCTLRLGTLVPRGTTPERLLLRLGEAWRRESGERVQVRVFSDGRLGGESDMLALLQRGQLQAAVLTAVGLEEIDNAVVALQKPPMAFASLDEVDHVVAHAGPLLEARLARRGFTVLFWCDGGWLQVFSRNPVERPADLMAQRIFMWAGRPAHVELMRAAGFNPVPLDSGDYVPAFRGGLIDAGAMPPFLALTYQVDSFAPHVLLLNSEPLVAACVVRTAAWEEIPADLRPRLHELARATGREITANARRESEAALAVMQKRGLAVHPVPPAAAAEWRAVAARFHPLIRGRIVDAAVFDRVQALLEEYRAAHRADPPAP